MHTYYIIAGEASGDLHGSNLIRSIRQKDPEAVFRFWGGDLMREAAGEKGSLVKHYRDLAFMGFLEVVKNLPTILQNISFCKKDIQHFRPHTIIFIDYPGFNLRIAPFAKSIGVSTVYYISPQLWAWKEGRVKIIKRYIDKMLVILPFEKEFYKKHNIKVDFVGHPLLDAITRHPEMNEADFRMVNGLDDRPIVALLPGSRKQEIKKMLLMMLSVREEFSEYQFVIAGAPGLEARFYEPYTDSQVNIVFNQTYNLLQYSQAALVTSGTATLETALFGVPQVVCYRSSRISYEIGRRLVKNIKYISLVNLILDRPAVKELIQENLNKKNLAKELKRILKGENRNKILQDYNELRNKLGGGDASERASDIILKDKIHTNYFKN